MVQQPLDGIGADANAIGGAGEGAAQIVMADLNTSSVCVVALAIWAMASVSSCVRTISCKASWSDLDVTVSALRVLRVVNVYRTALPGLK